MERSDIKALTFDLFGTILDLGGSLTPYIAELSKGEGCGRVGGSVLGSVAGAATDRAVSGHACDVGA